MSINTEPVTIDTVINASPQKVWTCFTGPEHIVAWNAASDDWHTPTATNDLRVGGSFSSRMEAKDGSFGFDFTGVYDEVIDQRAIAYTMPDGRKVRVEFEPAGSGTRVIERFDPETEHPIEMQRQGWQAILDNFKRYTETQ